MTPAWKVENVTPMASETPKYTQITLTSAYNQCSAPTGPTQVSGNVYYVTVSCAGQNIAPAGQSAWRREVQFRVASAGTSGGNAM